uniref:SprT-like domain-containing protein n=1 Tax=Solibacter usitatus (strain Ellin6076) TaxID=234267 RepID=Q01PR6_SOLUE
MLGCLSPKASGLLFWLPLLLSSACAFAQSPAVEPDPVERTLCAGSFVAEKLWYWQHRLNLQDWDISIVVARASELKPRTLGNIHWDATKKTAIIRVLDPADYELSAAAMFDDMEFTVVHELIHLELAPVLSEFSRNEANRRDEEHAVNRMAEALLKLKRGK